MLTEEEIIRHWGGELRPLVTVCCTTFNHARFIHDAMNGFLSQKTKFPFEIMVHDDASTDGTAEILAEYAAKYPKIVVAILQTENQFSQGRKPLLQNVIPLARGAYLAICEGDDFWTVPHKLQSQVELLEEQPDLNLSFHPAKLQGSTGELGVACDYGCEQRRIPLRDVILGRGAFMPTASLLIRRDALDPLPAWLLKAPVGDYFLQVIGSARDALYMPEPMCCYRVNTEGSWSHRQRNWTTEQISGFADSMSTAVEELARSFATHSTEFDTVRAQVLSEAALMLFNKGARAEFRRYIEAANRVQPLSDRRLRAYHLLRRTPSLLLATRYALRLPKRSQG